MPLPRRLPAVPPLGPALLALAVMLPGTAGASPAGDALRRLQADNWVARSVSLEDLGIRQPVVLADSDARQDFYLPIPRHVPLADAALRFDGAYLKGEPGSTSLVLWTDGLPTAAQRIPDGRGPVTQVLGLSADSRETGFVRLGVDWQSDVPLRRCQTRRATANALTISPRTRLDYRFDAGALDSLDNAWEALPTRPVLLVAGRRLPAQSFDTAWRIGAALARAGKRVQVRALPAAGDMVNTEGLQAPAGLAQLPAFAAVAGQAAHRLGGPAELGALLVLGAPAVSAHVAVADDALRARLNEALDALQAQFGGDADAVQALRAWRQARMPLAGSPPAARQVLLARLGSEPVIALAPDAGAQASAAFDTAWRRILIGPNAVVRTVEPPQPPDDDGLRLTALGGSTASIDVLDRGDWTLTFPLSAVATDGQMPAQLVMDLAAAPGASATRPVASVFWNGILLSAAQLRADGQPEQLSARVPGYALGVSNAVRVSFQRQPVSVDCNETPQGFPVAVLPTSRVRTGSAEPDGTFVGLLPLLGGKPQLLLPQAYLEDALAHLPHVIGIAAASGLSASHAVLTVVGPDQAASPSRPFLAMEVGLADARPRASISDDGKGLRIEGRDAPVLDVSDLQRLSTAEVVQAGGQPGILWRALGQRPAPADVPFLLNQGDLAVIGPAGPLAWTEGTGAAGGPMQEWRRYLSWGVPVLSFGLLILLLLLIAALRVARRKHGKTP